MRTIRALGGFAALALVAVTAAFPEGWWPMMLALPATLLATFALIGPND